MSRVLGIYGLLSSHEFSRGDSLIVSIKRSVGCSEWDAVLIAKDLHDTLSDILIWIQNNIQHDLSKKAYIDSVGELANNFWPSTIFQSVNSSQFKQNINTLLFLNGNSDLERAFPAASSLEGFIKAIDQLLEELEVLDIDDFYKEKIQSLVEGVKLSLFCAEKYGSNFAWSRLSEMLLTVTREAQADGANNSKKWMKKAAAVSAGALAFLAAANSYWNEGSEFLENASDASNFIMEAFRGEQKLIEDKTK